jgi:hypothetical protein
MSAIQFDFLMTAIVFDGILTLINIGVLAISVKLVSEFYKVTRLSK